jgi:outer membrane biosynthesis protein TonB
MKKIKKKQEKRKIKEESKSLISETINGLSIMTNQLIGRRKNDDDEEMDSLIRTTSSGGSNTTTRNANNNTIVWKTLAFVLFAVLILFATDVIEFKEASSSSSSSIHSGHNKNSSSSEISMIDGSVEQKKPIVVATNTEKSDTENTKVEEELVKKKAEEEEAAAAVKAKIDAEAEAKKKVEEEAASKKKVEEEAAAKKKAEDDAAAKANADEKAKKKVEEEAAAKLKAEEEAKKKAEEEATAATAVDKSKIELESGVDTTRHTYKPRGRPMSDEDQKVMVEKWGSWMLEDKKERPTEDYYLSYPNRDVPRAKFPANAWQTDKEWLSKFLPESISLVDRTINAILDEYGQPKDGSSELFHVEKHEAWIDKMEKEKCNSQVGCTTSTSWKNLKRRLLHAVMTEDMFVFAMGGHSSAAGHGNHFQQSYTLQVQWILEGVFSRLGVRHQSRNFGLGGLGTTQSGLATKSLLGHDVDMLLWDSGMFYISFLINLIV